MAQAHVSHRFPISADALWALIGDFGDVGKWSGRPPEACIQDGEGIGALRTLTLADGGQIVDRLDAQGPYFYSYSIVTSPLPVKAYTATMAVAAIDDGTCELTWRGDVEPDGVSDAEAVALFEGFYRYGIALMEKRIAGLERADLDAGIR